MTTSYMSGEVTCQLQQPAEGASDLRGFLTIGGDLRLLSCRNSSSVTISLPGDDGPVLALVPPPRCG